RRLTFEAHHRARERPQPVLVALTAADRAVARIVGSSPGHEPRMGLMHAAAERERFPISLSLSCRQASESDLRWYPDEDHQVKQRDEDVAPPAERAREHPRGIPFQVCRQELLSHVLSPLVLK